jgi:uncharacterized protein (DUF4415 family)
MRKKSTTATFDDEAPVTQNDIDSGRLVLRKRVAGQVVLPKKRVTLYLDASIVDHFKEMAGERGYQTLINEALKTALRQVDLEATLRKVIREELKGRKAAWLIALRRLWRDREGALGLLLAVLEICEEAFVGKVERV